MGWDSGGNPSQWSSRNGARSDRHPIRGCKGRSTTRTGWLHMSKSSKGLTMRRKVWSSRSGDGSTELIVNGQVINAQNGICRNATAISYKRILARRLRELWPLGRLLHVTRTRDDTAA